MAHILIVGDGAIGLLLSHFLSKQHKVYVLTRKSTQQARIYCRDQLAPQTINAHYVTLNQLPKLPTFERVIFAVKAFQVQPAFTQIHPHLSAYSSIIISHNGMGNIAEIQKSLHQKQALYFLTTNIAAFKKGPYTVQHTGDGQSTLGDCNPLATHYIAKTTSLLQAIPALKVNKNIQQLRFQKLLVNIAINPLTAIHNIKNGQLRDPQYRPIIEQLLTEACAVAKAEGFDIPLKQALDHAYQVMALTTHNYSSMHQDITHHRPTEIMAICGYISEQGEKYGISTPANNGMCKKICNIQRKGSLL